MDINDSKVRKVKDKQRNVITMVIDTIVPFVLTFLVFFFVSRFFTVIISSPDDILFGKILSGEFTGEPSAFCYFLSYPHTLFLSSLYRIKSGIHWYEWYLIFTLAVSFYSVIIRIKDVETIAGKVKYIFVAVAVLLGACLLFLVNVEWNAVTGIATSCALFCFITNNNDNGRKHVLDYIVISVLLLLAVGLRRQMVIMFIPLFIICLLWKILSSDGRNIKEKIKATSKQIIGLSAALIMIAVVIVVHSLAYSDKEWKSYAEYTKSRSLVNDYYGYPSYEEHEQQYLDQGIYKEDYSLIALDRNYLIGFDQVEHVDFSELAKSAKSDYYKSILQVLGRIHTTLVSVFSNERLLILHLISIVFIVSATITSKNNFDKALLLLSIGWGSMLILYFSYQGRLPYRISSCIELGMISVTGGYFYIMKNINNKDSLPDFKEWKLISVLRYFMIFALVIAFSFFNVKVIKGRNREDEKIVKQHKEIIDYCSLHSEDIFIRDFDSYSQQGKYFQCYNMFFSPNYIVSGGWTYNSPLFEQMTGRLDYNSIEQAINESHDIYYLVNGNKLKGVKTRLNNYFIQKDSNIRVRRDGMISTCLGDVYILQFYKR